MRMVKNRAKTPCWYCNRLISENKKVAKITTSLLTGDFLIHDPDKHLRKLAWGHGPAAVNKQGGGVRTGHFPEVLLDSGKTGGLCCNFTTLIQYVPGQD
jgi:hypothetical protein